MLVLVFVIEFVGKSGPPVVHVLSAIFKALTYFKTYSIFSFPAGWFLAAWTGNSAIAGALMAPIIMPFFLIGGFYQNDE